MTSERHQNDIHLLVPPSPKCISCTTLVLNSCDFQPELPKCLSFTALVLQSCDIRAGAAEVHFLCYTCTDKLRLSRRSFQSVFPVSCALVVKSCDFRVLPKCCISVPKYSYLSVATFEPELQKCTSCTTLAPTFEPELQKVHFLCYTCAEKLRLSSRSCRSALPLLHLY